MRPSTTAWLAATAGFVAAALALWGCYQALVDAVVDDSDHEPGGSVSAELGAMMIGPLPALASGQPLAITGSTQTVLFAIILGADAGGRTASDVLTGAGRQLSLMIGSGLPTQLQFHVGGMSCVATSGQVDLLTGTDMALSGSFATTGTIGTTDTPCALSGTLTAIPQYR